jgi:AraC-like DNA-binding protein
LETNDKTADAELKRLPETISSLIGALAIPAVSAGDEPRGVIASLLDVLMTVLQLDFAYARFSGFADESAIVLRRTAQSKESGAGCRESGSAIATDMTDRSQASSLVVRRALRGGSMSIARLPLGLHDEMGCVVAGSRRAGFPSDTERLLLGVAVNRATVGLQGALLTERQRIAEKLDRKVAQHARELRAANFELERALRQIDELKAEPQRENNALREKVSIARGGLAPWQARRAKELMNANLNGKLPLSQLAEQCGLSIRHFARAFRQSTGVPPHRWLLGRRIERAKQLLHDPALALAEVALACGFADQSHFTRMFTTVVGLSPGLWRRAQSLKLPSPAHWPHMDFTSPPSIRTAEPVSHLAPGDTRNAMSSAISSGVP